MNWNLLLGVSSQGAWSVLSFVLTLALARYLTLHDFGWYATAVNARLFILTFVGSLLVTPLTVLSAQSKELATGPSWEATIIDVAKFTSIALILIGAAFSAGTSLPGLEFAVFAIGGVAVEIQRRLNFVHDRVRSDLAGGVLQLAGTVGTLVVIHVFGLLTLRSALAVIGFMGILWAAVCGSERWLRWPQMVDRIRLGRIWSIGSWVLGSGLTGYGYAQTYFFLTLYIVGPVGAAILELGRQLVALAQILIVAMANMSQPKLAKSAADNSPDTFRRFVWLTARRQTLTGGILLLGLLIVTPHMLPLLFPGKEDSYDQVITVSWILAAAAIFQLLWQHPSFAAIALGKPQYGFASRLAILVVLVPVGYFMTMGFGLYGAAWVRALAEAAYFVLAALMLNRAVKARIYSAPLLAEDTK